MNTNNTTQHEAIHFPTDLGNLPVQVLLNLEWHKWPT